MRSILLSLPLLAIAGSAMSPAFASRPAPVCDAPAAPPAELTGWAHPVPVAAGGALVPGTAARVTLAPVGTVTFVIPVGRMTAPADKGGIFTLAVPSAGTYRVALGAGGWIDMVKDKVSVPSAAHAHGPDCTGIRKMVDFPLAVGTYTVQISGAAMEAMTVLVVRLP